MLIENTGVGVMAFGLKAKGSKPVLAIPGINRISDKDWKELGKNPSITSFVEKGRLKLVEGPSVADLKKAKSDLAPGVHIHEDFMGMSEDVCAGIVRKCLFLPLLKNWLDGENRPKVVRALHEQIDLAGPTEVKKEK